MKGVGRHQSGESIEVPRRGRRRRDVTPAAALELRGDTFARLHHVDGYPLAGIAHSFGLSTEQVRLDVRASEERAKVAKRLAERE